jgi:hypothetical protein
MLRSARGEGLLLCGPFAVERERAYLTLVLWARTLASRGFEVMRFDYRGQGESTGAFEDMTIARWREDAAFCAARLSAATQGGAVVLQGVRLGALIAAELFASGVGEDCCCGSRLFRRRRCCGHAASQPRRPEDRRSHTRPGA